MTGNHAKQPESRPNISFGEISALLAVAAIGIYLVGLFALWFPISRTFTGDFTSAWYAVSLLPRTVVAGQGVRQVLAYPVLSVFVLCFIYLAVGVVKKRLRVDLITASLIVALVIAVLVLVYLAWILVDGIIIDPEPSQAVYSRTNLIEAGIPCLVFL